MKAEVIQSWLRRKRQWGITQQLLLGTCALIAGLVILFLTFWFTYVVILIGSHGISAFSELVFSKRLYLSHTWRLICSGVFIALLFIQHFRTRADYWGQYPDREYVTGPALPAWGGVGVSLGVMLAYPGASANMVADILLSGPRLVVGAWSAVGRARALQRIDTEGCAELLAFLRSRNGLVPYDELTSAGWEGWLGQLRSIEGVSFLTEGLVLMQELRQELNQLGKE